MNAVKFLWPWHKRQQLEERLKEAESRIDTARAKMQEREDRISQIGRSIEEAKERALAALASKPPGERTT